MLEGQKTTPVKVRLPAKLADWLRDVAEERYSGNLSAAMRRALLDARRLERVRTYLRDARAAGDLDVEGRRHLAVLLEVLLMIEADAPEDFE